MARRSHRSVSDIPEEQLKVLMYHYTARDKGINLYGRSFVDNSLGESGQLYTNVSQYMAMCTCSLRKCVFLGF